MTINLSQYVGKRIIAELMDGSVLAGKVEDNGNEQWSNEQYPYKLCGWLFNACGQGVTKPRIVKILTPFESNGIAQKAPNINLEDFVGQCVCIKLSDMKSKLVVHLSSSTPAGEYAIPGVGRFKADGSWWISSVGEGDIVEIYGEGAYEINTKSTFDNPNDYQIEQAKQLLNQMSEEQVAKLLKSLKSNP